MDLKFSAEDEAFRAEVREFFAESLPADIREMMDKGQTLEKPHYQRWQRILYEKGWATPHWPVERGGTGWTPTQMYIFEEEMGIANVPHPPPFGAVMLAPVLLAFGNKEQQDRHLPGIQSGETWWAQGYSEPGAGSDLASLSLRAVREGDEYVLNGQKTWTTMAHYADWIFCLVRTDTEVKKQEGISFILMPIDTPGITVRPLMTMQDEHTVNEVFFDNVRVPAENLVGEENKGWTYAKYLLGFERTSIADVGGAKRRLADLKKIARAQVSGGKPLIEDPAFRRRIADLESKLMAHEITMFRSLAELEAGNDIGPVASIFKIWGTELSQDITEAMVEATGYQALSYQKDFFQAGANVAPVGPDYAPKVMPEYLSRRVLSIFSGSNEIQRNVIAKAVLGL